MAEKEEKGSSIDVMSTMKKGLKSVAMSGAKWAIGKGLNAAFGWESAKDKKMNWVRDTLNNITAELAVIEYEIANISEQIRTVGLQIETQAFIDANGNLSQEYIDLAAIPLDLFKKYTELVKGLQEGGERIDAQSKIDDILRFADELDKDIIKMENKLRTQPDLSAIGKNIFETWTDSMIVRLKNGEGEPLDWYLSLETKARQLIQTLFKGYIMQINIKNYQLDNLDEEPDMQGVYYLEDSVYPVVRDIVKNYIACVERFVLSTYRPDLNPSKDNDPVIRFTNSKDIKEIFRRTDLFCWLFSSFGKVESTSPGLIYRSFTRPSLLEKDGKGGLQGAVLQPDNNFEASRGELAEINPNYDGRDGKFMGHWFRCLDFADGDRSNKAFRIRSFEDSSIQTLRYHWPLENQSVKVNQPIGNGSVFSQLVPRYYNKFNARMLNENELVYDPDTGLPVNAVLMGSYAEGDSLRENILMSYNAPYSTDGWEFKTKDLKLHEVPGNQMTSCKPSYRLDDRLPYYGEVSAKLTSRSHSSKHKRKASLYLAIDYVSSGKEVPICVVMDSDYTGNVGEMPGDGYAAKAHMDFDFKRKYPEENFKGKDRPDSFTDEVADHKKDVSHVKYKSKDDSQVQLYPSSRITFEWILIIHIEKGKDYHPISHAASGDPVINYERPVKLKWNIENFRLAWPFPTIFSA